MENELTAVREELAKELAKNDALTIAIGEIIARVSESRYDENWAYWILGRSLTAISKTGIPIELSPNAPLKYPS